MFKRLGHIAIRAKDIEVTAAFYRDILGMKEAFRMYNGEGGALSTVYLCAAPGQFIEIFPGGSEEREINDRTIGYSHLCIEVENVEETCKELLAKGLQTDTEVKTGFSKSRMFWTHDPDGNRIEFMELTPESLQAQAIDRMAKEQ
ncbi:MAG: VOC family protein [Treponema sp.]|jgi:lactoylglutathione lyase|nr:VOC family protein [Treponema sp.]